MSRTHTTMASPLGELTLVAEDGLLCGVYFERRQRTPDPEAFGRRDGAGFEPAVTQLGEYFAGERTEFTLPIRLHGGQFRRQVWEALRDIPYGQTRSYGQIAEPFGPGHEMLRKVAAAIAANPVGMVVPCHRVISADGGLKGYAGGLERKRLLLDLEAAGVAPARLF
jgi:methylated-DNA-[protein]-cysteine S-methyltransferase